MSDKPNKVGRNLALKAAKAIMFNLSPACERIEIVGSLRRDKQIVSDVELLYIPKRAERDVHGDMFATKEISLADEVIGDLEKKGVLRRRLNALNHETYGPLNKLMVHVDTGVHVDLFATSIENWWVSLVIRTGSRETNLRLTTGAQKLGRRLQAYGAGVLENGHVIPANNEQDLFKLCGVPYLEPKDR